MEKRWIWPFELEEQIGAGAMGVVYRARFVKNDRRVALKLLPTDVAANETLAARFQREMELLKDLRHPHIVHCFGGTCEGDHRFYAMELIPGGTLASLIEEQGRLPWRQSVEFGTQICEALEYAHDRQIIHRDLKPGNLLITQSGKLKLSDFGLAQMASETRLTAAGKTVGSLHYMAPEQIQGKTLSSRTDLYALGCVLYEMLTGRPPFQGDAMAEILERHVRETPRPISSIALDCPPQLEALVGELLAKNPDNRPKSAQLVARRLREIDHGVTIKLPRFDRNRTLPAGVGTETVSVESIPPARRPVRLWPIFGLVAASALAGWMAASMTIAPAETPAPPSALIAALQDANPPMRALAAQALGEIGPDEKVAVPALIRQLSDDNPAVRLEVVRALGKARANNDVLLALTKTGREDAMPTVRDAAVEAKDGFRDRPRPLRFPWMGTSLGALLLAIVGGLIWVWRMVSV